MSGLLFTLDQPAASRYIRTSWMLSADRPVNFADNASVRLMTKEEANGIAEMLKRKNTFERTAWGKGFYVERAEQLGGRTVIELFLPGQPDDILSSAETYTTLLERLIVLASTFRLTRAELHRKLGIHVQPASEHNLVIGPKCYYLRSTKQAKGRAGGLPVDSTTLRRFSKLGFQKVLDLERPSSETAKRILMSMNWLFESRIEPTIEAAVVKTSIAFETLLVFSESEALARSLSERTAFFLSDAPNDREVLSTFVKRFYEVRSGIVHGGSKKMRRLSAELLECADQCLLAVALRISSNIQDWGDANQLRDWCEARRWGYTSGTSVNPVSRSLLTSIIDAAKQLNG